MVFDDAARKAGQDRREDTFQMAEVAVPRHLFTDILRRIDRLRPKSALA